MIPERNEDVVAERRTADGRWVLFTSTDVQPHWPLRWWGAVCDTGADGFGLLVRLDEAAAPTGWTALQLIEVARRRLAAEGERLSLPATRQAVEALGQAAVTMGRISATSGPEAPVSFRAGAAPSPYPWTVASQGGFDLALCPDPESREEGIAPEQLLIVLHQLLHNASRPGWNSPALWQALGCVSAALSAERRRLATVRA
jgi:hypothetical protein